MSEARKLDLAWLGLVLLTLAGAAIADQASSSLLMSTVVALVLGFKVRIVCDHYLELPNARPRLRQPVYLFCYGMPILIILTSAFGDLLATITRLFI